LCVQDSKSSLGFLFLLARFPPFGPDGAMVIAFPFALQLSLSLQDPALSLYFSFFVCVVVFFPSSFLFIAKGVLLRITPSSPRPPFFPPPPVQHVASDPPPSRADGFHIPLQRAFPHKIPKKLSTDSDPRVFPYGSPSPSMKLFFSSLPNQFDVILGSLCAQPPPTTIPWRLLIEFCKIDFFSYRGGRFFYFARESPLVLRNFLQSLLPPDSAPLHSGGPPS